MIGIWPEQYAGDSSSEGARRAGGQAACSLQPAAGARGSGPGPCFPPASHGAGGRVTFNAERSSWPSPSPLEQILGEPVMFGGLPPTEERGSAPARPSGPSIGPRAERPGSAPAKGTRLVAGSIPGQAGGRGATHRCVSPPPLPLSLKSNGRNTLR